MPGHWVINSKLNLKRIVGRGYNYTFANCIKSMKIEITDIILDEDNYQEITDDEKKLSATNLSNT